MARKLPEHIRLAFERGGTVTVAGRIYASAEGLPEDLEDQGYATRRAARRAARGLEEAPAGRLVAEEATRKGKKDR